MTIGKNPTIVTFEEYLDDMYGALNKLKKIATKKGHQMYREKLTQRLYRQLRNDGMTKPEAVAAIELGTGDKPLPVHHSADPSWATYSNKQLAMESMPHYHQLKRRRF